MLLNDILQLVVLLDNYTMRWQDRLNSIFILMQFILTIRILRKQIRKE